MSIGNASARQLERVRVRLQRRLVKGPGDVRFRTETLKGSIVQRIGERVRVKFDPYADGRRRDGSARGCTLWVEEAACESLVGDEA